MIENFNIVCKAIDDNLGDITNKIYTKYIKKCQDIFDYHYKILLEAL